MQMMRTLPLNRREVHECINELLKNRYGHGLAFLQQTERKADKQTATGRQTGRWTDSPTEIQQLRRTGR